MSFSLNQVTIGGYLTRDPQVRYPSGDSVVADFGIAMNESYTKKGGGKVESVVFVDVTVWGKTAELAGEYLHKGSGVVIVGRLKMDEWEDKQSGQKRSKLTVTGNEIKFLPRSGGDDEGGGSRGGGRGESRGGGRSGGGGGRSGGGRGNGSRRGNEDGPGYADDDGEDRTYGHGHEDDDVPF